MGLAGLAVVGTADSPLWSRFALVLVGYLAIGVAVAAVLRRRGHPAPGDLAAVLVVLGTTLTAVADPLGRWVSVLPLDSEAWPRTATIWSSVIGVCAVVVVVNLRDVAAPPPRLRTGRRRQVQAVPK